MNKKIMIIVAMLQVVSFSRGETVLSTASSVSVPADTTFVDGSSIGSTQKIDYGPFDWDDESVVKLNGSVLLTSNKRGKFTWQPQRLGASTLVWSSAGVAITTKVTVASFPYAAAPSPNPPMAKDANISITPTTAEFEKEGGYYAITTSGSSSTWTAAVSDPWIVLNATSGQVGKGCAYTVTASTNVETRTGYVYVSGHVHTVVQAGHGATISKNNVEVECDGGTDTIDITVPGKYGWNARPNVDWLSVTPTRGVGSGSVTYQVAPWHEVSTRSGTLTVGGNTFTVFQYGKRMKLSTYKVSQNYEAHVIPVTVDALAITKWSVTPNASWISIVDAGSGQGGDDVGIAIAENPSYKARTGTVTIGTETLTIVQEGRTALSFAIDPAETTADVYGANGLIAVLATPDLPWTAVSQSNWLTVYTKFKSGAGNGNIAYTVSPNPTLYDRTGTIKVTPEAASGVAAKTHTVTQPAALSSISLTSYEFAAAGEICAVEVTVDDIVEWQVENPVSWLTVVGDTTRVGPATITIQAAENTTVYPRSCTMTIARKTFTVRQLGRGVRVDTDSFVFGTKSSGSSFAVSPDGNVSWRPVASDDSWIIILDDEARTGSGEVKFVLTQYNGTGEARTGTITVGDKVVYITQRAFDLSINPTGAWVTGNAGAGEIGVSAPIGAVWEAIVTAPWIKVISGYDSGTGSGTVRYTYEDNDTGKTRSGKIVISGTAYVLEQAARVMVNVKATAGHGGAVEGGGTYSLGTAVTLRAVPSDGYVFAYWEGDVSSMQNPIEVTADVAKSVKAVFTPLTPEFISVSNSTEGVTLVWSNMAWATEYNLYRAPSQSKSGEPLATIVADGTHEYFDASGEVGVPYWYWVEAVGAADTNECVNAVSGKKLKPIVISNISYTNLRGATHTNPATYQEGTVAAFILPQGGPVGYTFAGWTPSAITADMTGDQTVAANWTANAYSIVYHANGGSGTMDATPMTYDVEGLVASNGFTRAGQRFVGWATSADGAVVYAEGEVVSNLTESVGGVYELWAKWAECKVETPTITPVDGSFFGTPTCTVTLSCATDGARIYYRTGGGKPKFSEPYLYKGPFTISDTTIIKAIATNDNWAASEVLTATLTKVDLSLEAALDVGSDVTVTTGGDVPWETVVGDVSKTGDKCAQSGAITDDEETWIQLAVSGAGTMSFWTKVSCEADDPDLFGFDHLAVFVDGVEKEEFRLDGESDWVPRTVTFTTTGAHTVKIVYEKDELDLEGEDCAWLDGVVWAPSAAPADPIPDIGETPTAAEVAAAVADATDSRVAVNIDETNYNDFRDWAGKVKAQGGSAAGPQGVMNAQNAWMSFALGQDTLLEAAPTDEDLSVEAFTPAAEAGKFDFTVSVKDVEVGSEATKENLKKVFGLEGAATLDSAAFSGANVEIEFDAPADGKVRFTAGPKEKGAGAFFMRVRMAE